MKGEHNLRSDRRAAATSMNKAVCATHCGIGIVSEVIKWGAEGEGGQRGLGAALSPDALTTSCPAKNQTSGSVSPASTAAIESEQERQLFSGHLIYTFVGGGGTKERRRAGSWNYLHIITHHVQNNGNAQICRWNNGTTQHRSTLQNRSRKLYIHMSLTLCLCAYRNTADITNSSLYFK